MSWDQDVTAEVYAAAPWAVAAVYDGGGATIACTVILESDSPSEPEGLEVRVTSGGIGIARLQRLDVSQPVRGATLTVGATVYTIEAIVYQDDAETRVAIAER